MARYPTHFMRRERSDAEGLAVHELDARTLQWFLRYLAAIKQQASLNGRIVEATAVGRIREDVELNIQRGLPSSLVIMRAADE